MVYTCVQTCYLASWKREIPALVVNRKSPSKQHKRKLAEITNKQTNIQGWGGAPGCCCALRTRPHKLQAHHVFPCVLGSRGSERPMCLITNEAGVPGEKVGLGDPTLQEVEQAWPAAWGPNKACREKEPWFAVSRDCGVCKERSHPITRRNFLMNSNCFFSFSVLLFPFIDFLGE